MTKARVWMLLGALAIVTTAACSGANLGHDDAGTLNPAPDGSTTGAVHGGGGGDGGGTSGTDGGQSTGGGDAAVGNTGADDGGDPTTIGSGDGGTGTVLDGF